MYDFLVVGAGSSGVHTAFFLKLGGAKVAVVEQSEVGAGGSGAAGAFISPRVGKGGPIQKMTNEAFRFCVDFYKSSPCFYNTGIFRLPKESEDFSQMIPHMDVDFEKKEGGLFFPQGGILKAKTHLLYLLESIPYYQMEARPIDKGDYFEVGDLKARHLVLATGAWDELLDLPYLKIGKTSGVRFDIQSPLSLPYSIHKKISISANIDGIVSIGATHQRLDGRSKPQPPNFLFEEAKAMVGDFEYEIEQMYCGIRSSVNDHLPIIGNLVYTIPKVKNYKSIHLEELPKKRIAVINGLGGRGFVFGPYMGSLLAKHLLEGACIPQDLDINRYVIRYLKKGKV